MKILRRYILREHLGPFVAALGVLTGLMLLNQLAKRFGDLVGKGLPWYVIAEVFGLSIPFILAMTMPMAVLVAVLYTFARLSGDNEVTAIKAGGVSLIRLIVPVLIAATALAAGMVWFNDSVLPESNHALRQLLTDINRKRPTFELRERVINEVVPGKLFLQAARIDRGRSVLRDLVIFDLGRADADRTIYADSGHMAFNETQTDLYLTLYDGSIHERDAEDPGMDQRTNYHEQVIRVAGVSNELERGGGATWRGDREMDIAMMRDEVRSRRERFRALQDSLSALLSAVAPFRDTASAAGSAAAPGDSAPEPANAEPRRTGPGDDAWRARGRKLRRIASAGPRASWPPAGDPTTFAARVRADLQRIAARSRIQLREISRYSVEIHKKFAIPIAAIVFVLIGAPIGVRFPRGGIGMVIGVSLAVFCVYYVSLIGGEELADRTIISPFWAMWAPNALFAAVGVVTLYLVMRTGCRRRRAIAHEDPA